MSAPENPAAFPSLSSIAGHQLAEPGMSMRDWFAGRVLPTLVDAAIDNRVSLQSADGKINESHLAQQAYAFADAMLAQRAKGGPA